MLLTSIYGVCAMKNEEYINISKVFSAELFDFIRKLMQKISTDIDNNIQTPQSEIYSLMNILKNLPQVKQYEISKQKTKQPKPTGHLSSEIIEQIEREGLGIEHCYYGSK